MGRISVPLSEETNEQLRLAAAKLGIPVSKAAELAIGEWLAVQRDAELGKPRARGRRRETEEQRKERFLTALESSFHVARACRKTGIPREEVRQWVRCSEFADQVSEAQAVFIEWVEWKLIRMGVRKEKPQLLALMSFLNAQHPQWGRLKYESILRWFGPFMEGVYNLIRRELGDENGDALCKQIREAADKALSRFGD